MSTSACYGGNIFLIIVNGILVNGPYALITTAVSADLGTHPSLKGTCEQCSSIDKTYHEYYKKVLMAINFICFIMCLK